MVSADAGHEHMRIAASTARLPHSARDAHAQDHSSPFSNPAFHRTLAAGRVRPASRTRS
jgi:hypothetical protein